MVCFLRIQIMVMKDSKDVVDPRYVLQFMCHGTNTVMMCVCRLVLMIHFYARDPFWIICIEMFIRSGTTEIDMVSYDYKNY